MSGQRHLNFLQKINRILFSVLKLRFSTEKKFIKNHWPYVHPLFVVHLVITVCTSKRLTAFSANENFIAVIKVHTPFSDSVVVVRVSCLVKRRDIICMVIEAALDMASVTFPILISYHVISLVMVTVATSPHSYFRFVFFAAASLPFVICATVLAVIAHTEVRNSQKKAHHLIRPLIIYAARVMDYVFLIIVQVYFIVWPTSVKRFNLYPVSFMNIFVVSFVRYSRMDFV